MFGWNGKFFVQCSKKNLGFIVHRGNFGSRLSALKLTILTASSTPYSLLSVRPLSQGFPAALLGFFLFFAILKKEQLNLTDFVHARGFFLPPSGVQNFVNSPSSSKSTCFHTVPARPQCAMLFRCFLLSYDRTLSWPVPEVRDDCFNSCMIAFKTRYRNVLPLPVENVMRTFW